MKFTPFKKMAAAYRLKKAAKARADELGCRIKAAIDEGKFRLSYGYLQANGEWCDGCAVAAAAFTCGFVPQFFGAGQDDCQRKVQEYNLMSAEEAAQLEMGYENLDYCDTWTVGKRARGIKVNRCSPFYKLGRKMGIDSGHISEDEPLGGDPW